MTNPTSNFNWQMPTASDLVTDLPADFETFGQAVDTSLADLKGGTTGQVLSKTSGTDMDFTWVDTDDTNAIQNAIVDAKGDLIAASAADTPARLAVGNNGESLFPDSSTSTGLRWQSTFAAGRNKILNSDFSIWQRGTSFSATGSSTYTADRWTVNAFGGTTTVSRQTFTPGTAPVAGYEGSYFLRFASSATFADLIQKVEDVRTFAGQTVTISFWAKAASSLTLTPTLSQEFGSGGSGAVDTAGTAASVTTSWTRFTATVAVPSISGKTIGTGSSLWLYFLSSTLNTNIDIWGVQLEAGSVATAFQTATGTIQGELAACQRYYYLHASGTALSIGNAGYYSATQVNGMVQFPVSMRIAPSLVATTGADYYIADRNGASDGLNSLTIYRPTATTAMLYNSSEATGTAGHAALLYTNNASSSVAFSAEL
jgi:hypothetical protein